VIVKIIFILFFHEKYMHYTVITFCPIYTITFHILDFPNLPSTIFIHLSNFENEGEYAFVEKIKSLKIKNLDVSEIKLGLQFFKIRFSFDFHLNLILRCKYSAVFASTWCSNSFIIHSSSLLLFFSV